MYITIGLACLAQSDAILILFVTILGYQLELQIRKVFTLKAVVHSAVRRQDEAAATWWTRPHNPVYWWIGRICPLLISIVDPISWILCTSTHHSELLSELNTHVHNKHPTSQYIRSILAICIRTSVHWRQFFVNVWDIFILPLPLRALSRSVA